MPCADAASVVLRIRAVNPSQTESAPVAIKSHLPARVRPEHIIRADGLTAGYDVKEGLYYVEGDVALAPKEVRTLEVEIEDIWTIPPARLQGLRKQAESLASLLSDSEHAETARRLQREVDAGLARVETAQQRAAIGLVQPLEHIQAYERNLEVFERTERDIGVLENLAIAAGKDPGTLIGAPQVILKAPAEDEPAKEHRARVRLDLHNPSPNEKRTMKIKHYLPRELAVDDVLDAGELKVGIDSEKDMRYVYGTAEIEPLQTVAYEIVVRDRWRVDDGRVPALYARATNMLAAAERDGEFESVVTFARNLSEKLGSIAKQPVPETLNAEYIAFYRDQRRELDKIDGQITRIENILRTAGESGADFLKEAHDVFKAKAPEKKTTWAIIYMVIGFLFVVSFLFFLRWYGVKS